MTAGRELDALVAEKVMGHRIFQPPPLTLDQAWEVRPNNTEGRPLLPYSTDIIAAWQVVAKLMDSHFMVSVNCSHESGWWAVVYPSSGPAIESEYASSGPHAICLAALEAVGIKVES